MKAIIRQKMGVCQIKNIYMIEKSYENNIVTLTFLEIKDYKLALERLGKNNIEYTPCTSITLNIKLNDSTTKLLIY